MDEQEKVGEFFCPQCGVKGIYDPTNVTIYYPKGTAKPKGRIICDGCNTQLISSMEWSDAWTFDFKGAQAHPFSFARGKPIEEEDIQIFAENFDEEMKEFLDASVE